MRVLISAIALSVTVSGAFAGAAEQTPLIITNVTLIDGTGAAPLPHMNVRIESGHLVEITRTAARTATGDVKIDGTGKFLGSGIFR